MIHLQSFLTLSSRSDILTISSVIFLIINTFSLLITLKSSNTHQQLLLAQTPPRPRAKRVDDVTTTGLVYSSIIHSVLLPSSFQQVFIKSTFSHFIYLPSYINHSVSFYLFSSIATSLSPNTIPITNEASDCIVLPF